ncbi:MAG: hypothetical protein ACK2UP_13335 [Candidatus Promineifilaceae bacterium]
MYLQIKLQVIRNGAMPDLSGIEAGREVRRQYSDVAVLIFITQKKPKTPPLPLRKVLGAIS